MSTEMQIALVGVIGTLAGTFLGWLLNNISQRGKLNIYISEWKEEFSHIGNIGASEISRSKEEAKNFSYRLTMDLYNSSGNTKIMRNIKVVFNRKKECLAIDVPKDSDSGREIARALFYDDVGPVNIPPKSVGRLNLRGGFGYDNLDVLWEADSAVLQYADENNKIKTFNIKKVDYLNYFDKYVSEDENNG